MAICWTFDGITKLDNGIWKGNIDENDLSFLGDSSNHFGELSVLIVRNPIEEQEKESGLKTRIKFEPRQSILINKGSSSEILILEIKNNNQKHLQDLLPVSGDEAFIKDLKSSSPKLNKIGNVLLNEIRKFSKGNLRFHPKSKKYVERPDNFWVIRIQPRDDSLRLVVRGLPDKFADLANSLTIKKDMTSYSSFKVFDMSQVPEAVRIIRRAKEL